jgi:hypothetical protein
MGKTGAARAFFEMKAQWRVHANCVHEIRFM